MMFHLIPGLKQRDYSHLPNDGKASPPLAIWCSAWERRHYFRENKRNKASYFYVTGRRTNKFSKNQLSLCKKQKKRPQYKQFCREMKGGGCTVLKCQMSAKCRISHCCPCYSQNWIVDGIYSIIDGQLPITNQATPTLYPYGDRIAPLLLCCSLRFCLWQKYDTQRGRPNFIMHEIICLVQGHGVK